MSLFSTLKLIQDISKSVSPVSKEHGNSSFLAASIKYLTPHPVITKVETFSLKVAPYEEDFPTKINLFQDHNFS